MKSDQNSNSKNLNYSLKIKNRTFMNLLQEDQKKLIQDFQQRIIKSKAESYQFLQPTVQGINPKKKIMKQIKKGRHQPLN